MRMSGDDELEFRHWLDVLRRRRWLFFGVVCACLLAGVLAPSVRGREYAATATVLVGQPTVVGVSSVSSGPNLPAALKLAVSDEVTWRASAQVSSAPKAEVTADTGSGSLSFAVNASSGQSAANAANAYATAFLEARRNALAEQYSAVTAQLRDALASVRQQLAAVSGSKESDIALRQSLATQRDSYQAQLNSLQLSYTAGWITGDQLLVAANPPTSPSGPGLLTFLAVALAIGLLLGTGLLGLAEFRDDALHSLGHIRAAAGGLPLLGRLGRPVTKVRGPAHDNLGGGALRRRLALPGFRRASTSMPIIPLKGSPRAESFRSLAAMVVSFSAGSARRFQVTSARADDGAQDAAVNLAVALAAQGLEAVLVCPDGHMALGLPLAPATSPDGGATPSVNPLVAGGAGGDEAAARVAVRGATDPAAVRDGDGVEDPGPDGARRGSDKAVDMDGPVAQITPDAGVARDVGNAGVARDVGNAVVARDVGNAGVARDVGNAGVAQGARVAGIDGQTSLSDLDMPGQDDGTGSLAQRGPAVLAPVVGYEGLSVATTATMRSWRQGPPMPYCEVLERLDKEVGVPAHVVVLSPPLLTSALAQEWASSVDGTVLCVRADSTTRSDLREATSRLAVMGVPVLGIVLT